MYEVLGNEVLDSLTVLQSSLGNYDDFYYAECAGEKPCDDCSYNCTSTCAGKCTDSCYTQTRN